MPLLPQLRRRLRPPAPGAGPAAAPAAPQRTGRRLGPASLGARLVYDDAAVRRRPARFDKALTDAAAAHHVTWLLRELRVDLVLDVGANKGQFARALRRGGYEGRIASLEPLAPLVAHLREASADDPLWTVHPWALGEESGTAEIHMRPGAMSSLLPSSEFGRQWSERLQEATTETIEVRRLDDVWAEVTAGPGRGDPRPFLKLDTQGYDLPAFRGAGARVAELLALQSEVSMVPIYDGMPRLPEALACYEAAGFETTGMFPVTRDRASLRVIEFDLVMIGPRALDERRQKSQA